jgi:hypothetical protein
MIEVFMLFSLFLCFLDLLIQTHIHYVISTRPKKKGMRQEDEEEGEGQGEEEEDRQTLYSLLHQQILKGRTGVRKEKPAAAPHQQQQQQLGKSQIFDLAMSLEAVSMKEAAAREAR